MAVDWYGIFDAARIPWKDRGPNTSRNNINIACPWCGDDPSFHLGVAKGGEAYFCYREPRHAGRQPIRLLTALGLSRNEAIALLNVHNDAVPRLAVERKPASPLTAQWERFLPIKRQNSGAHLDYLEGRGFQRPLNVAETYDLRYSPQGMWAYRLLLPFAVGPEIMAWTGRTTRAHVTPKYLSHDNCSGLVYVPRPPRATLVIVEGPLDALKIAAATEREDVFAASLNGKHLGPNKLLQLVELTRTCTKILVALDDDTSVASSYGIIAELLSTILPHNFACAINRLALPDDFKDAAEMSYDDILEWTVG